MDYCPIPERESILIKKRNIINYTYYILNQIHILKIQQNTLFIEKNYNFVMSNIFKSKEYN